MIGHNEVSMNKLLLRTFEQIEFTQDEQILFKYFVIQMGIGHRLIVETRRSHRDLNDIELVKLIKKSLSEEPPEAYLRCLFLWHSAEWVRFDKLWGLFYKIHILYKQIRGS